MNFPRAGMGVPVSVTWESDAEPAARDKRCSGEGPKVLFRQKPFQHFLNQFLISDFCFNYLCSLERDRKLGARWPKASFFDALDPEIAPPGSPDGNFFGLPACTPENMVAKKSKN
jgi:hypothetical protein